MTGLSNAWVLVTPAPNNRDANASVVPRSFGGCSVTGPLMVLTVVSPYPLRLPARTSSALVAGRAWRLPTGTR